MTTKIHKFTVYVYGFNDLNLSTKEEIAEELSTSKWNYIIHPYHEKTLEIEQIHDHHPLNMGEISKEKWELYMNDELKRLSENKIKADKELEKYQKELGL